MYEWAKAFHLIAMTAWFAALFYLPRLFVYHAMAEDSISIERFKIMQRKLYRGIANPSMIATLGFGIWLLSLAPDYYLKQDWFIAKIAVVLAVVGYHYSCSMHLNRFATDSNHKSHRYFRVFNEVPVLFLTGIVILVVVKPF
jgi:putative membrane protein